ncbi:MAG: aminotransferase class V-fold PLP-dependent enzyme [Bacillota bacterium]|jgi:cysteine desulfurase family protein
MIFFDNAAGSHPKPPQVREGLLRSCEKYGANPGRGAYKMSLAASRLLFNTRERLAKLFGCADVSRVVFTAGATAALNQALKGVLKKGDHVIYSGMEHNAVWRPLKHLESLGIITTTCIKADKWGYVSAKDFSAAMQKNTRMLVCTHASNVTGSVQPIKQIGCFAKEKDLLFLVDAAQSAALIPIDMQKMNISLLAFAGHKTLYGPAGIGGLCVADDVEIRPLINGGTGSNSQKWQQPEVFPDRLESGSLNMPGIAGLSGSLDFLDKFTPQEIYDYTQQLADCFCERISELPDVCLFVPPSRIKPRVPVVSLTVKERDVSEVAWLLDNQYNICVRAGLHCTPLAHQAIGSLETGTLRFSFGVFNTKKEINQAVEAMRQIIATK